jgi:Spy/CpxP family protein refolding chaperone
MRTMCKTIVALGVVAFLAAPAMAQQGRGGGRGFGGGAAFLLGNASVQQELKLDAGQIDKAKEVAGKAREKMTAARESLQSLEGEEQAKKRRELTAEINTETHKAVKEFMKPEQVKRLYQITHQVQGAQAFTDEHVQKHLKLTDAQKSDIEGIVQASGQEMRKIFQENQGDREAIQSKMTELRKETLTKVESKLTDEQKSSYKEMLGAPFEVKYEPRPGGN